MKLLALLLPCAFLPLAAALLSSSGAEEGPAAARLDPRAAVSRSETVGEPVRLVDPAPLPLTPAAVEREGLRQAVPGAPQERLPTATVAEADEAPSGLDALPPPAREVARLRQVVEERLGDRLGPGGSCPDSLVLWIHRARLDPAELSERDLLALHREHLRLQGALVGELRRGRVAVGATPTPAAVAAWGAFEARGDALLALQRR